MKLVRLIPVAVAIIVAGFVAMWPPLKFANLGGADFASRFSVIVFFSLLIERTVEILLSIWRSEEANKLEAEVQRLLAAAATPAVAAGSVVAAGPAVAAAAVAPGAAAPAATVVVAAAAVSPAAQSALTRAQNALIEYKAETLQWAMPVGFAFGLLVSGLGVRALSQFVDLTAITGDQVWWFRFGDIVFTGALLAGGADPIHKLLDLYRKFVESSAARAAGTR